MADQINKLNAERLITIAQTCAMLGISRPTIYRWLKNTEMAFPAAIKIGPNSTRFRLAAVEAFINNKMEG